jgi:hypothetical protein
LFDVSVVVNPAYAAGTSVQARGFAAPVRRFVKRCYEDILADSPRWRARQQAKEDRELKERWLNIRCDIFHDWIKRGGKIYFKGNEATGNGTFELLTPDVEDRRNRAKLARITAKLKNDAFRSGVQKLLDDGEPVDLEEYNNPIQSSDLTELDLGVEPTSPLTLTEHAKQFIKWLEEFNKGEEETPKPPKPTKLKKPPKAGSRAEYTANFRAKCRATCQFCRNRPEPGRKSCQACLRYHRGRYHAREPRPHSRCSRDGVGSGSPENVCPC